MSRLLVWLWSQDVSLGVFLILLIGLTFFLLPLGNYQGAVDLVANLAATMLLLSGGYALIHRTWGRRLVVLLGLGTVVVHGAAAIAGGDVLLVASATLSLLVLALLMVLFLVEVYRPGPITRYRIGGGVAAYLLLGLTWAYVYVLIEFWAPGSLRFPGPALVDSDLPRLRADVLYFSFVTLTTLGYGDILPVSAFARSMAVLEALIGQLFVATLIGRLVSLRPPSSTREQEGEPPAK